MMDFDEFDDIDEPSLADRLNAKRNNTAAATTIVDLSPPVSRFEEEEPILITPPPPPAKSGSSKPETLTAIQNLLKKNDKPPQPGGKRKAEFEGGRRVPKEKKVALAKVSKQVKDAEKMVNKQTEKSEVNKYVMVLMDPALISTPPGSEIINLLSNPPTGKQEETFQYKVENQRIPCSLTWKRKIIHMSVQEGEPVISSSWVNERRSLVFLSASEVAEKMHGGVLDAWAESIKFEVGADHHVTLMVYDFNAYFRQDKNMEERSRKAAIRGEQFRHTGSNLVTQYQMQEALLTLSINRVVDHLTFDRASDKGWKECGGSVFHQTRAVAEAPEKLKKSMSSSASFEFFAKADGKDCVSNKNLAEYWKQVIMQITVISLEKATAIARRYPSPTHLIEAYRQCFSVSEAEKLLADIEIRRVDTIVGGIRRIGDEISRKVYQALTSDNPNSFLQK